MTDQAKTFIKLYRRDLKRLSDELDAISEEHLWEVAPGIINSCGVLAQHLTGNINYFIGTVLGDTGYERDREREFSNTGLSKTELINKIDELKQTIETVLASMELSDFEASHSGQFPYDSSVRQGIVHLYGHLNYHLGQVNYLRRMIEEKA